MAANNFIFMERSVIVIARLRLERGRWCRRQVWDTLYKIMFSRARANNISWPICFKQHSGWHKSSARAIEPGHVEPAWLSHAIVDGKNNSLIPLKSAIPWTDLQVGSVYPEDEAWDKVDMEPSSILYVSINQHFGLWKMVWSNNQRKIEGGKSKFIKKFLICTCSAKRSLNYSLQVALKPYHLLVNRIHVQTWAWPY